MSASMVWETDRQDLASFVDVWISASALVCLACTISSSKPPWINNKSFLPIPTELTVGLPE